MSVAITKIDSQAEYCEITNLGSEPVDMTGYNLNAGDRGQDFQFPDGFVLAPGQMVRVYSRAADAGPNDLHYPGNKPLWNNAGDEGVLTDGSGAVTSTNNFGTRDKKPGIVVKRSGRVVGKHDFGKVALGDTKVVEFTIANNGESDLYLTMPLAIDSPDFAVVIQPAAVVPPGGSTTMSVVFKPTGQGKKSASLTFASNAAETPVIQLLGTTGACQHIKAGAYTHKQNKAGVFTSIKFGTPFPEGTKVTVNAMVQTFNGAQTPDVRIKNVSEAGFAICIHEILGKGVKADGVHLPETMGWIAVGQCPGNHA